MIRALGCLLLLASQASAAEAPPPVSAGIEALADGATIVDCYDQAVARLELICDDYRRIKAIQLARLRDIAFADAYGNIVPVMPQLEPIDRGLLLRPIYDADDVVPHRHAVIKVEAEVQRMVDLAAKLLEGTEQIEQAIVAQTMAEHPDQKPLTLEEILARELFDPDAIQEQQQLAQQEQTEQMKRLQEQAKEDPQQRARDLTGLMREIQPLPDIKDLTKQADDSAEAMDAQIMRSQASVEGDQGPLSVDQLSKTLGRQVTAEDGEPVEWMFVDTWYTIGPFPNPSRINLHKKFPPETAVDLNAAYVGKGERPIGWKFLQMGHPRCAPHDDEEYAIYYAYTELYFDRPMDLWIAIGSDDKANVWINDLPVWISGDALKGWRVNEGFRKVGFRAGVNRVLYRVENGWHGMAFSLGLKTVR